MLAIGCLGTLLVLPGLGVAVAVASWRSRRLDASVDDRDGTVTEELARAIAVSVVLAVLIGYFLIATTAFTDMRLAVAVLPFAALGVLRLPGVLRRLARSWLPVAVLLVLSVPFVLPALRPGYAPINNFNWYYWSLGKDLSLAHGIPSWVAEYGMRVRWQPDYLSFSVLSEGFRGLFVGQSDIAAVSMFKVPVALLTLFVVYAAFRLWFRRPAALLGTALLLVTTVSTAKLGNARPEILGFALGLVALVVGIHALRRRQPAGYVLAATLLAVAASVHAIGALVAGVLLVAGTLCEIAADRRGALAQLRVAVGGAVAFAVVVAATGWALQGRLFVGSNAGNPHLVSGSDPTLTYFRLSEGLQHRPDVMTRLLGQLLGFVQRPAIGTGASWVLVAVLVACLAVGLVLGSRRTRQAVVVTCCLALFLALGVAWFALRYDTFVPQNTGLSRFTQWAPLCYVLAVTCAVQGLGDAAGRHVEDRRGGRRVRAGAPVAAAVVAVLAIAAAAGWAVVLNGEFPSRAALTPEAAAAVAEINKVASPDDVLLTNVASHGILEFTTRAEVPLEGRQPVIENLGVLEGTNSYLRRVTAFFTSPRGVDPGSAFAARWVLVTDQPQALGATRTFGPPLAAVRGASGLTLVWHRDHTTLYRATPAAVDTDHVGPSRSALTRFVVGLLACLVLVGGAAAIVTRRPAGPRRRRAGRRQGPGTRPATDGSHPPHPVPTSTNRAE